MSEHYLELYKKYRPKTWDDVIGQETIVNSLKNSVINNKIPTAYLFSAGPGQGKTTIAFILAKALNCEHLKEDGSPCNECATCKAIDERTQIGVRYISMANNGSAEDVRRIMQEARLAQPLKKQVWIMDEVQNLSPAAQDALLTSLESEDMKSLFIFCTTDPEKIKPAVLSRLQQRTLNPIKTSDLLRLLGKILKSEGLQGKITKEQAVQAAQEANGSARNAIRNLEMLLNDGKLPNNYSLDVVKKMLSGNSVEIYQLTNKMAEDGQNFAKTLESVYRNYVDMLQIKAGHTDKDERLIELSKSVNGNILLQAITEIGNTLQSMSNKVVDYRILFEICSTKIALLIKKSQQKQ